MKYIFSRLYLNRLVCNIYLASEVGSSDGDSALPLNILSRPPRSPKSNPKIFHAVQEETNDNPMIIKGRNFILSEQVGDSASPS